MHPVLFEIFGTSVHTYGVLYLLAFLASIFAMAKIATRYGIPFSRMVDVAFMIAIAGEVGARLTFLVVEWERFAAGMISMRQFLVGGRVVLGGVVVGVLFAAWIFRRYALPVAPTLDALLTAVPLGMGIGRLGCLAGGCCFGRPTDAWWGITFVDPVANEISGTPLGIALIPTQILQAVEGVVLFVLLLWLHGRKRFHGQIAATFLVLSGISRFLVEFLRADPRGAAAGVTTSQWIGVALTLAGLVWLGVGLKRAAGRKGPDDGKLSQASPA